MKNSSESVFKKISNKQSMPFFSRIKTFVDTYDKVFTLTISLCVLAVTIWIGYTANGIAKEQTDFVERQTQILDQQTQILQQQTDLQSHSLQFDKDKLRIETEDNYREKINILFDAITSGDAVLTAVHNKVQNNEKVWDPSSKDGYFNLNRYVNGFENIGALYCNGKIKLADLRTILKDPLFSVCNNNQINDHYRNTKSGISSMCKQIHPKSKMAKWENDYKCTILNK